MKIIEHKTGRQSVEGANGKTYDCLGYIGETRVGYLCAMDFKYEMGEHVINIDGKASGTVIYDSLEELRAARSCVEQCGYVKVILVAVAGRN